MLALSWSCVFLKRNKAKQNLIREHRSFKYYRGGKLMNSKGRVISRAVFILGMVVGLVLLTLFLGRLDTTQASDSKLDKNETDELQTIFEEAAKEFHVAQEILMSVSYNETRWNHHNGEPSTSGGYGIMHMTQIDQALNSDAKGDGINETAKDVDGESNLHTLNQAAKL